MKRYLLDSNALNLFMSRRGGIFDRVSEQRRTGSIIGTAIPVVAEFLGGVLYSDTWEKNYPKVEHRLNLLKLWPFDLVAARQYAHLYAQMRRNGIQMQVIDSMVAAIALVIPSCIVISNDSDFGRVDGLRVENWELSSRE